MSLLQPYARGCRVSGECKHVNIYIHTYTRIHTVIHIHMYMYICICIYIFVYIPVSRPRTGGRRCSSKSCRCELVWCSRATRCYTRARSWQLVCGHTILFRKDKRQRLSKSAWYLIFSIKRPIQVLKIQLLKIYTCPRPFCLVDQ